MADITPQLKRKRESAIGLQKKAKKPRKSDAIAGQDAGTAEESVITAPVDEQIPATQAVPQPRDKSKSTSRKPQTNGQRDQDVSTGTLAHAEPDEEQPQAEQEEVSDDGDDTTTLSKALRKQNKKQRKLEYKASKKPEQLSGDKSADESEAQGTPARSVSQAQEADNSAKKRSLKERASESKQPATSELQDKALKVQSTPARSVSQEQDLSNSTQKKTFKERVLESKKIAKAEFKPFKEKVLESKEAAKAESKPQASTLAKAKKQKHRTPAKWAISPAQGGWFLPFDPVFSLDEKYIILANTKCLQIYSTETSLLASVLPIGSTGSVTAYALSSTKPSHVYVADSNGLITLWNWADGTKIGRWDIGATVRNMVVITQPGSDEDLVYCHEAGNSHIVNVHALRTNAQASKTELKRVLKAASPITNVQVLLQGKYVIISTAESITVGKRLKVTRTAVQEFEYVWRELKFSKRVTTCHTYFRQPETLEKGKRTAEYERDILDLAVGDEIGVVLLFEDILASFAAIEPIQKGERSKTDSAESFRPKRLHWHRDAVGSVKWSLDGELGLKL
jgi:NET1-associated nuclear protein 1 (U3 small nucleolar RNA-associated protein 17)